MAELLQILDFQQFQELLETGVETPKRDFIIRVQGKLGDHARAGRRNVVQLLRMISFRAITKDAEQRVVVL